MTATMAPRAELDKALSLMRPAEARAAVLRQRGVSIQSIADDLGVDRAFVSKVNAGRKSGPATKRVEKAIARALGLKLHEAFPERYGQAA